MGKSSTQQLGIVAILVGLLIALGSAPDVAAKPPVLGRLALTSDPLSGEAKVVNRTITLDPPPRDITSLQPASLIMTQGFEGAWPASGWQLNDVSTTDGGEYLWGKRNCHPHTGSFGGWSVGGGAQGGALPCSANYPNDINTNAIYGPFNLSNATAASLTFYFWGSTEGGSGCPFDVFFVGSSINGTNFSGQARCGSWTSGTEGNGYYQGILDLSSRLGQSQVWIVFAFVSDSSVPDIGITIDDVTLDVSTGNLTSTPTATKTPTTIFTATTTRTPTSTPVIPVSGGGKSYLPLVMKQLPPTATPTPISTPTATLTPASELDGNWNGTTSQGQSISFTILSRGFTRFYTAYVHGGCGGNSTTTWPTPRPITGSTFSLVLGSYSQPIYVNGTFDTNSSASGTLEVVTPCGTLTGVTWTATKQ